MIISNLVSVRTRLLEIFLQRPLGFLLERLSQRSITVEGRRIKFNGENWITNYRIDTFFSKEPETLKWLRKNLRAEDVFFDVGANIGLYSIYAASLRNDISVLAFEPEYSNLDQLKKNINLNKYWDWITPFSIAFDKDTAPKVLNIQDSLPGSALHSQSRESTKFTASGKPVLFAEGIMTCSVDEFCDLWRVTPALLKSDVDGTEDLILLGAKNTLKNKCLRSVLIEVDSTTLASCNDILIDSGLRLAKAVGDNQIWIR